MSATVETGRRFSSVQWLCLATAAAIIASGCIDAPGRAMERSGAAYDAALRAVFDTLRLQPERMVFPDRYVTLESFTDTEAGPRGVFEDLASRYPESRACSHDACDSEMRSGETMVFVSRLAQATPVETALAVMTYHYSEGNTFGDGFRIRLSHDGERWVPLQVVMEWVPE